MEQTNIESNINSDSTLNEKIEDYTAMMKVINKGNIPFYHKICMTIEEAARYAGIGENRMRQICDQHEELYIWNGTKKLIKREALEEFIRNSYTI